MSIHRFDFTASLNPRALPSLGTSLDAEAMRWGPSPREAMHAAHRARLSRMAGVKPIPVPVVVEAVPPPPPPVVAPRPGALLPLHWSKSIIRRIQSACAEEFGVSVVDIISHRRTMGTVKGFPDVLTPRFVAIYLAREFTPRSLPEIGRMFGGRDHSTVLHSLTVMVDRLANDPALAARVDLIRARVKEGLA